MSVAVVGTPTAGIFTSGTGVSYTAGAGSNRAVVLTLSHTAAAGGTPNYTGVQPTFGGVNMIQAGTLITNTVSRWFAQSCWYLPEASIPSGAQTMVASWNSGTNNLNEADALASIYTLSGVNQASPTSGTDSGVSNAAAGTISGSGLVVTAGSLVVLTCGCNAASNTLVTPAGYTQTQKTGFDFSGYCDQAYKAILSNGTETPAVTWTGSSDTASIMTINFQPLVVGAVIAWVV